MEIKLNLKDDQTVVWKCSKCKEFVILFGNEKQKKCWKCNKSILHRRSSSTLKRYNKYYRQYLYNMDNGIEVVIEDIKKQINQQNTALVDWRNDDGKWCTIQLIAQKKKQDTFTSLL